ncbi:MULTISPECIES: AMP-binding protein [unclassified Chelatococcus]|uniref:AMP-binding protein n=1 Tax=unclassified Chelatococcus TaxID=2638111 RepID=UPI001BCE9D2D|nr:MULTISPECIES: AMP-binding protein [unclassified Chelatococcus]MBS7700165.1 AMP-binding protein [Chelatococcus sp. YT9]MBX3556858.1 AMP-binding protein [Chelatococcus sp.]
MANASPFRATLHTSDESLGRAEFLALVEQAAAGLHALGVEPGDCVSLLMRNDSPFLVATAAVQLLGAYAVPLNWHFKKDELLYVIQDCEPKVMIAHADLLDVVSSGLAAGTSTIEVAVPPALRKAFKITDRSSGGVGALSWSDWLARQKPIALPSIRPPDAVIYTSGTTGRPKGVRRAPPTAEQAIDGERMRAAVFGIGEGDRVLVSAPLYHTAPNFFALRAMRLGEILVVLPRFDPEDFLATIERHRITHVYAVPTMFVRLLALDPQIRARYDVSSLRFVLHAGGPCPQTVKQGMIAWLGPIINEYYGSTEHGPLTFCTSEEWLAHRGTVGRAAPGVKIAIQDQEGGDLPTGVPGEIIARNFAHPDFTYHRRPADRAELQRGELVATGDVGYFDASGFLYLCDRKRDLVISGGVNIYPAEIEGALAGCPGIADSAIFGVPDAEFGERLIAVVQPREGVVLEPDEIRAFLSTQLASYKIPAIFLIRDNLPREETGKIRKRLLRDEYIQSSAHS